MSSPLACVVCSVDPQTSSLILPIAQATIVAAPFLLRERIRKAARALQGRGSGRRAGVRNPVGDAKPRTEAEAEGER